MINHNYNWNEFLMKELQFCLENLDPHYIPSAKEASRGEGIIKEFERFAAIGELLADEKSRIMYKKVLAGRISTCFLDLEHYLSLRPFYTEKEWADYVGKSHASINIDANLFEYFYPYELLLYAYRDNKTEVKVENGDVVIDVGAFTGNTSIHFAQLTGKSGKVYAFEASPKTAEILSKNVDLANEIGVSNINVVQMAVSDKEETLRFPNEVALGNRAIGYGGIEVSAIPLDAYIKRNSIDKVDFIKMDIEGAEMAAIDGAREIIEKHSPKLAVSVYHKPDDLYKIPEKVLSINPNYEIYLNHGTRSLADTVMFFVPSKQVEHVGVGSSGDSDFSDIKSVYVAARNSHKRNIETMLFENVAAFLRLKHSINEIDPVYIMESLLPHVKWPLSNGGGRIVRRDEHSYRVTSHFSSIQVSLYFSMEQNKNRELIRSFLDNLKESDHTFPNLSIYEDRNRIPQLVLYFSIQQSKDPNLLRYGIHRYKGCSEQISDYLVLLIEKTLPFLVENGFVSGDTMYYWRGINSTLGEHKA